MQSGENENQKGLDHPKEGPGDMRGLFPEEIGAWLVQQGEKSFRGKQVFQWLQARCVRSYDEMTDISQALRIKMAETWPIRPLRIQKEQVSRDGTRKYLFELEDGQCIETVLMAHTEETGHIRHTLCLSTQVGCAMGCTFCATGEGGFMRNLTAAEIVGQVLDVTANRRQEKPDFEVHNLVYMGMGEPLLNYDAVLKSIRLLNHPQGQQIGIRRITLSTCGIPDQIRRLAGEGLDIVLALSLHSPDPELRSELMPVNRRYPLQEVMDACRAYVRATGRRMTFEYTMIQGVNMGSQHAEMLCRLLKGIQCNVNLIPVNVGSHGFKKPGRMAQEAFRKQLMEGGLEAVIREEKGSDIAGACGQLAGQTKQGVERMAFEAAGKTDVGLVRKENQDNYLMVPERGIFAVADGMGGHAGGRQASAIAVEVLSQRVSAEENLDRAAIDSALEEANQKILERARQDQMQGMGTTLTLAFFQKGLWQVVHIGDSRAYAISPEGAYALTQDHSLVGELLAQGSITRDEAQNHPHRNILTRALGSEEKALPEWNQVEADRLDYLLLCTDGLYNLISDDEIKEIALSENQTLDDKAAAMVELAKHKGGFDNITAILIKQEG